MKRLIAAVMALVFVAAPALADPAPRVAPSLAAHTAEFDQAILNPAPGVYVAVGYGLANSIMVVGRTGVVIIDTLDSLDEARKVWAAFEPLAGGRPVVAIIYTHNHNDHINGASAFPLAPGGKIIAQASLMAEAAKWNGVAAPAIAARAARMFGPFLPRGETGVVNAGIGPGLTAFRGGMGFVPPNTTFDEALDITLGGERFQIRHAPGETDDQLFVWLPDRRVLMPGDNIYRAFPNLYTIRGTSYRDPVKWADSLDRMRALGAVALVPSHTRPVTGEATIRALLTDYRDAIRFVHDQTVRWMNQGLSPDEVVERVRLPQRLAANPFLAEHYGTVEWSVRSIFAGYMGWFGGDAAFLSSDPPKTRAQEIVDLAGGGAPALAQAQKAFDEGRYKWAAELCAYIAMADDAQAPAARALEARALRQLGYDSVSPNGRNYYLTQAGQLEGKIPTWGTIIAANAGNQAGRLRLDQVMATFPVRLNAEKAANVTGALALHFTGDDPGDWTIVVRQGVVELQPRLAADAPLTVTTTKLDWIGALQGPAQFQAALAAGKVKIDKGDVAGLAAFLSLFRE
ncbi:MAG: alkyl sulfatase dimerization domain-containing protein [Caulobacteraceae bacterium]